jgi:hypothetical protein
MARTGMNQDNTSPIEETAVEIGAEVYNRVRLALLRLGSPLKLGLRGMRNLRLELNEQTWLCLDRNNRPVVVWTGFENQGRTDLKEPVRCRLRIYHSLGGMLARSLPEEIEHILDQRLRGMRQDTPSITEFPRRR